MQQLTIWLYMYYKYYSDYTYTNLQFFLKMFLTIFSAYI